MTMPASNIKGRMLSYLRVMILLYQLQWNAVSSLSVSMSKFNVMRPSNFHEVLKTSVQKYLRHNSIIFLRRVLSNCLEQYTEVFRTSWKFEGLITSGFDIGSDRLETAFHYSWYSNISTRKHDNIRPFMFLAGMVIHYLKCGFQPVSSTSQHLMWRDPLRFSQSSENLTSKKDYRVDSGGVDKMSG